MVRCRLPVLDSDTVPSSDRARLIDYSAQNLRVKVSTSSNGHSKVHVFKFSQLFRGSYFHVLVVGHENRENLDLAKISHYTVSQKSWTQNYHAFTKSLPAGKFQQIHALYVAAYLAWNSYCVTVKGIQTPLFLQVELSACHSKIKQEISAREKVEAQLLEVHTSLHSLSTSTSTYMIYRSSSETSVWKFRSSCGDIVTL